MSTVNQPGDTFVAKGITGQLIVTPMKVVIHRKGFFGFSMQQGDKEIRIDQITAVQMKKPGLTRGFIRLAFTGGQESKQGGAVAAANDENAILFKGSQTRDFEHAKQLIEYYQGTYRQQQQAPVRYAMPAPSAADELDKLAALKDRGVLTQAEFDAKKRQILGL